uniref:Uncharacterized protein n=1 Tax=Arundo donax TaxID=35708 RepID=A0A0A9CJK9_ARUDO
MRTNDDFPTLGDPTRHSVGVCRSTTGIERKAFATFTKSSMACFPCWKASSSFFRPSVSRSSASRFVVDLAQTEACCFPTEVILFLRASTRPITCS